ncbi:MAG: asparagine synthase (glutamine-hydrolyzing), partial [Alphaproteobacteria bacterium]
MCGIAGILGPSTPDDHDRVVAMTAMLRHRGPNATRTSQHEGAVFGHTRLSIIDLTDRALQPMASPDGRHVMVFNGEIYNYRELRRELQAHTQFRSQSDSEVLLAAYRHWGPACLDRFIGMFAFCIFDTQARTAFFARDRFGQKPLYLTHHNGQLLFASEVKALLAAGVPAKADMAVWARYLRQASYDDGPATYFAGITQLEPGECAQLTATGDLTRTHYYNVAEAIPEPRHHSLDAAATAVRELLVDAAGLHMRADVPVGISLSGGLDSSALLATIDLAGDLHDGVQCVSVDFGGDLTERPWIEAAAGYHHLQAHIVGYTPAEFHADIAPMIWQLEG